MIKRLKKEDPYKKYTKTFTSFGGADIVPYFNNKIVSELQAFTYHRELSTNRIQGEFIFTLFDRKPISPYFVGDVTIVYANEFGQCVYRDLINVRLITEHLQSSVDDVTTEILYTFEADDTAFYSYHDLPEDVDWDFMIKYVEDCQFNMDAPYRIPYTSFIRQAIEDRKIYVTGEGPWTPKSFPVPKGFTN